MQTVRLTTSDGVELETWFVTPAQPHTVVVVFNGNAGNRGLRWPLAVGLHERGHAVLLTDYRGYGGNPGRPDERGVISDGLAAAHWARANVDAPLVLFGESLGSAVAAATAAEVPVDALVLRSPFPSMKDVARRHYPFVPTGLLRERHPTLEHLAHFSGPVLVVAGERDRIVPSGLSRRVASGAGADYVELPGVGHNDRIFLDGAEFLDAVDRFVRDAV